MLNHRGGRILFGVEPDGRVVGQQIGGRTIDELAHEIQRIDPPVFPTVERVDVEGDRQVIVVVVTPGQGCPYSYKGQAYRRVGSSSLQMSRDEYNRTLLERMHGEQRWENHAAPEWKVTDLDAAEITRTIDEAVRRGRADEPGTRDPESLLRGFGLFKDGQLLRAAVALFGHAEHLAAEMPQCLLRLAKFRGTDKTEFVDNRQFHGNIFEAIASAERFLRESLPVAGRVTPV
jgi:ATP-dependent DNA helicase RecG